MQNRTTIDARILKRRIVESWDKVDGDRLLTEIARDDPVAYVKLIVSILRQRTADEEAELPDLKIIIMQNDHPPMIDSTNDTKTQC